MTAKVTPLAAALAQLIDHASGLHVMYVPDGLDMLAEEVVRASNFRHGQQLGPDVFAIMVDDQRAENTSDTNCRRVSMGSAIRYRRGPRLAVVNGTHTVTQSFSSAFANVAVDYDFPGAGPTRTALIDDLARAVITVMAANYPDVESFLNRGDAVNRLATALGTLADAYEALAQGTAPWNVYWFRHVDRGLDALFAGVAQSHGIEADDLLESITYASFGLPKPAKGNAYAKGRRVSKALVDYWGNQDTVRASLAHLRSHPSRPEEVKREPHPLEQIDFSDMDQRVAIEDNLLLAWGTTTVSNSATTWVEAFAGLTEAQFFSPLQGFSDKLIVEAASGEEVEIGGKCEANVIVFTPAFDFQSIISETIVLKADCQLTDPEIVVREDDVSVLTTGKGTWTTAEVSVHDGRLVLKGRIQLPLVSRKKMPTRPMTLSIDAPPDGMLAHAMGKPSSAPVYPIVRDTVGAWVFEALSSDGYRTGKYRGYETLKDAHTDPGLNREIDDSPVGSRAKVLLWGDSVVTSHNLASIRASDPPIKRTEPDVIRSGDDTISVGNLALRWVERDDEAFLSPLVAAARKGSISSSEPEASSKDALRGRLESYMAGALHDACFQHALGHMAMFENSNQVPTEMEAAFGGSVLVPVESAEDFANHINIKVSPELQRSAAAQRFRSAFQTIRISESLTEDYGPEWPSRTSWAHLHGSPELDEYLDAYSALIDQAKDGNTWDQFWAAFPFSLAVYPRTGASDARAVLLSPLHPLRLAWLAGAEAGLRASPDAELLAGILEGWNLPAVGPQSNSLNGRLIAIPVDAGHGQLFLGWSMLVKVSVAGAASLEPPSRIGAIQAPGTSVTGLNADGVRSALRTFRRMNPQVATLSLDLASSLPSPRLEEIDEAILGAITSQRGADETRGGVRVFDSLNRLGDPPLTELEQGIRAGATRPVRWSRYKGDIGSAPEANLRFLQDAGVKVEVTTTDVPGTGLLGGVPLRRITAPPQAQPGTDMAVAYPIVETGDEASSFTTALGAIERASAGVAVGVEMFKAALINSSADWTVTGESLLGASALADLLAADSAGQMLWEWRPPYLGSRAMPRLDARPFVSVVQVPPAFKTQIGRSVAKAIGTDESDKISRSVTKVMRTLGTRGIGLSTLMAQGGTHAAGAIGFYLALRLTEMATIDGLDLLVLPIDACDDFLKALARESAATNQLRRADLLILAVRDAELVLVPVEIKSYGLEAQEPQNLPTTANGLADPLSQLESTHALLRQLVDTRNKVETKDELSASLWRHGLAAMVEAAMRLGPNSPENAASPRMLLRSILDGNVDLRLGRSLICFFGHGTTTSAGEQHKVLRDLQAPSGDPASTPSGALVANTQLAMEVADLGQGIIADEWQDLLGWALSTTTMEPVPNGKAVEGHSGDNSSRNLDADVVETVDPEPTVLDSAINIQLDPSTPANHTTDNSEGPGSRPDFILDDGVRFSMGTALDGFTENEVEFWPSNTSLNQLNVGVVGDVGAGKTQFLRALIRQIRREASRTQPTPVSMLVFDYKRDFQDEGFLNDVGGHLLHPYRVPLDVLAIDGPYTSQKAVQAGGRFLDILAKIYGGIGPVQHNNVLTIIKELFAERNGLAPTIGDIHSRYQEVHGTDAVSSVLNGFVLNEIFSEDRAELVKIEDLIRDRVLVLAVSDLGTDEHMKTALITLFLNKYYDYMLQLPKWGYQGQNPQFRRLNSFVAVDEAYNIMKHEFPILEQLLLQGREFGVGVILSSQYIGHFKQRSVNYGEALLTKIVHKVPSATIKELKAFGFGSVSQNQADRILHLDKHEAFCKTLGVEGRFMHGTPYYRLINGN